MVASLFLLGAFTPLVFGRAYPAFYARDLNSSVVLGSSGFASSSGAVLSSTSDSTSTPSSTDLSTSVFSSTSDPGSSISSTVSFSSTGLGISVNSSTITGFSSSLTSNIISATSSVVSSSSSASVNSSAALSSSSSETFSSSGSVSSATAVPSTGFTTSLPANGSVTTTSLSSGVQSTVLSTESSSDTSAISSSSSSDTASSSSSSSSSTTGAAILTTSTDSPGTTSTLTSASTQVITSIEGSKVTTNTHISTTGSNGQQTIIPILFGCSFCGGGGLELFGFGPGPGVFEWPPSPAFSSLPPITIDSSDNPSVEETSTPSSTQTTASSTSSSSSSSSSSSCSSSTTTEEYVTCYAATTSGLTTTSASCSTVTSTISGCDLTATATTTTATATATCWQYNGWTTAETADDPDDSSDDDSDTSSKRSIVERNEDRSEAPVTRSLFKRAANEYSVFGNCKISKAVSSPSYPKKSAFNKNEKNAKKQNAAIRDQYWWEVVVDGTTCPGLAKLERNTEEISGTRLDRVNMDHVYEQSLPSDFLSYLFSDASSDICDAFERVFANTNDGNYPSTYKIQGTNPGRPDQSRLQTVFNFLPNNDNLALMGMDKILNEKKGKLFNDKMAGLQSATADSGSTQANLELWNQVGMLFEFMNTDVTQRVFSSVQSSMYAAWVRYDEIWASEACDQTPLNFAQKYQDFMSTRISTNAESAQAWATAVSETAVKYATTTDENGNANSYASAIDNLQASYAPEKLTWSTDPWLQFPQSTANIKRQAAACTISATTTTSGSTTSTNSASTTSASSSSAIASISPSSASNSTSFSITSTASSSDSSSVTSSVSSSVATACSFVATVYPSSLQSIAGTGTQRYCQCGPTIAGIDLATSGTSTTSYCALGSSAPAGFSQIPASNGVAISTSTSSTTIPSTASTTTTASATPSCDSMVTTSLDKLFEIFGKGWDGSILGNGAGLENSLSDCSGNQVQDWGFYYKTADTPIYDGDVATDYDFMANGTMKGIEECWAKAALEQGGCLVGGSKVLPTG